MLWGWNVLHKYNRLLNFLVPLPSSEPAVVVAGLCLNLLLLLASWLLASRGVWSLPPAAEPFTPSCWPCTAAVQTWGMGVLLALGCTRAAAPLISCTSGSHRTWKPPLCSHHSSLTRPLINTEGSYHFWVGQCRAPGYQPNTAEIYKLVSVARLPRKEAKTLSLKSLTLP